MVVTFKTSHKCYSCDSTLHIKYRGEKSSVTMTIEHVFVKTFGPSYVPQGGIWICIKTFNTFSLLQYKLLYSVCSWYMHKCPFLGENPLLSILLIDYMSTMCAIYIYTHSANGLFTLLANAIDICDARLPDSEIASFHKPLDCSIHIDIYRYTGFWTAKYIGMDWLIHLLLFLMDCCCICTDWLNHICCFFCSDIYEQYWLYTHSVIMCNTPICALP